MSAPTREEVRQWGMSLGLPLTSMGALPQGLVDRWNRTFPDRLFAEKRPLPKDREPLPVQSARARQRRWGAS